MTDGPGTRATRLAVGGAVAVAVAVFAVYFQSSLSYFFNDDFQWLQGTWQFSPANMLRLERYDHFYRPVIEVYFYLGTRLFGCQALPFHLLSVGIHLFNTLVLYLLAFALTRRRAFAALAALLFAFQPGYAEAVAWVGAITDLMPAVWVLLTLWLYLRYLQSERAAFYVLALVTFTLCLLTHETAATLLPMMVVLEIAFVWDQRREGGGASVVRRLVRYVPFALLLLGFLAITYIVNSRSYLVKEGHYQFGWHAIPNMFRYVVSLYIGKQTLASHLLIAAAATAMLVRGTTRMRLFIVWIVLALAPASFFTWGNVSRYLYVPGAGFALLLAEVLLQGEALARGRMSALAARRLTVVLALAISIRYGAFTVGASRDFKVRTRPYERYAAALLGGNAAPRPGDTVYVTAGDTYGVPDQYREPAAQVVFCTPDLHVGIR